MLRWALLVALFAAGLGTRGCNVATSFNHPDEPIAVGLNRWLDRSWDTNWKQASLPPEFDYPQYNFSSYHYAVHLWAKVAAPVLPGAWSTERNGVVLLRAFSVLCAALAVVWTFLLGEKLGGWGTGLAAAALVLVNPQLVADGHYARAEAMLTWLTLVVVWLAWCQDRWTWRWRLGVTAALVGFMIAAKVTLGLMVVVPLWVAWQAARQLTGEPARAARFAVGAVAAVGLTVAGFALGAPGALGHPGAFLSGVQVLANQYGGFHPPHSEIDGSIVAPALGRFYVATVGWVALALGVAAAGHWIRRGNWAALLLLALPFVTYVAYFAGKRVFFERNLSHVLPLGLLLVGAGAVWLASQLVRAAGRGRGLVAALILAVAAAPGAAVTGLLLFRSLSGADPRVSLQCQRDVRARYPGIEWRPISLIFPEDLALLRRNFARDHKPVLVQFPEFNDSYSRHYREEMERQFVTYDAGQSDEALSYLPCSTLTVYHGPRTVYKVITGNR